MSPTQKHLKFGSSTSGRAGKEVDVSLRSPKLLTLNGRRVLIPELIPKSIFWFYRL
jgi:hypothetical protein